MKLVVLAAFIAAFAAGSQTLAAVSSLPIGSVEKVLNHELSNTWQIGVNVKATSDAWQSASFLLMQSWRSYTKADGTTESVNALCQRTVVTGDKTELKALLQKVMREAVRVSVNTNTQGKQVQVLAVGEWQPDPTNWMQNVGTFSVDNRFAFDGVVPETAYETDMGKEITSSAYQGIFISNVVRGEVKDAHGNVIDRALVPNWTTSGIGLGNEILTGQPGTVQLWYADGTTQTFDLADGSFLSPLLPVLVISPVPAGAVSPLSSVPRSGVKLTVTGVSGTVTLEYSEDFKDWKVLKVLANSTGSVSTTDSATGSARFYRARTSGN